MNNMEDFNKLREEILARRKQERQAYWLLLFTSTYVIIHMGYYIWRNYIYIYDQATR